jgi:hypothetical protein
MMGRWCQKLRAVPPVDPADDGPEVDLIKFFAWHPDGSPAGTAACLHIKNRSCDFYIRGTGGYTCDSN